MYNPSTPSELNIITKSERWRFIRQTLWQSYIIEIHKLVSSSDNDHFSIKITMEKAIKSIRDPLEKSLFIDQEKRIFDTHADLINSIQILRDSLYAHTDKKTSEVKGEHTFDEFEKLNNQLLSAAQMLMNKYKDTSISVYGPFDVDWEDFKILAKERDNFVKHYQDLVDKSQK
jgi:hypothetical protein